MKTLWNTIHDWLLKEEHILKEKYHVQLFRHWFIPHKKNDYKPRATHHKHLAWYMVFLIVLHMFTTVYVAFSPANVFAGGISSAELLAFTNQTRAEENLKPLTLNPILNQAATMKAEHIFEFQYWAHNGPEPKNNPHYKTPWDWFNDANYEYIEAGENLAIDFATSEGVHDAWLASPTHKANIVYEDFTEVGFAIVPGVFENKETILIVQFFGTPDLTIENNISNNPIEYSAPHLNFPPDNFVTRKPNDLYFSGESNFNTEIEIHHFNDIFGKTPSEGVNFHFKSTPEEKLKNGTHIFSAFGKESQSQSNIHTVVIDTLPPVLKMNTLFIESTYENKEDIYKISLQVIEDPKIVKLSSREGVNIMNSSQDNYYQTKISFSNPNGTNQTYPVIFFAEDNLGNSITKTLMLTAIQHQNTGKVKGEKTEVIIPNVEIDNNPKDILKPSAEMISEVTGYNIIVETASVENHSIGSKIQFHLQSIGLTSSTESINTWLKIVETFSLFSLSCLIVFYLFESYILYIKKQTHLHGHPLTHAVVLIGMMTTIIIM